MFEGLLYSGIGWGLNKLIPNIKLIDFFTFSAGSEKIIAENTISDYKTTFGVGFTNFIYNNLRTISLENVIINPVFGGKHNGTFDDGYTAIILEALRMQQLFVPIMYVGYGFSGLVRILHYELDTTTGTTIASITFKEVSLFATFDRAKLSGDHGEKKKINKKKG